MEKLECHGSDGLMEGMKMKIRLDEILCHVEISDAFTSCFDEEKGRRTVTVCFLDGPLKFKTYNIIIEEEDLKENQNV